MLSSDTENDNGEPDIYLDISSSIVWYPFEKTVKAFTIILADLIFRLFFQIALDLLDRTYSKTYLVIRSGNIRPL